MFNFVCRCSSNNIFAYTGFPIPAIKNIAPSCTRPCVCIHIVVGSSQFLLPARYLSLPFFFTIRTTFSSCDISVLTSIVLFFVFFHFLYSFSISNLLPQKFFSQADKLFSNIIFFISIFTYPTLNLYLQQKVLDISELHMRLHP